MFMRVGSIGEGRYQVVRIVVESLCIYFDFFVGIREREEFDLKWVFEI